MLPQRKQIRLSKELYEIPGTVFHIIIKTADSRALFEISNLADDIFTGIINGPIAKESDLNAVCLMPDHLHLLQGVTNANLLVLIQRWKTYTTNRLHRLGVSGDIWQRSFYDHAMRDDEDLLATAEYIVQNPIRNGIVTGTEIYPYAWHKWM